jgi:hypothetical protein
MERGASEVDFRMHFNMDFHVFLKVYFDVRGAFEVYPCAPHLYWWAS